MSVTETQQYSYEKHILTVYMLTKMGKFTLNLHFWNTGWLRLSDSLTRSFASGPHWGLRIQTPRYGCSLWAHYFHDEVCAFGSTNRHGVWWRHKFINTSQSLSYCFVYFTSKTERIAVQHSGDAAYTHITFGFLVGESDWVDLDDLEELDRLNGDVELDEAVDGAWTQLLAVDRPQCANDACLLVNVEPPITAANPPAHTCCHVNAQ